MIRFFETDGEITEGSNNIKRLYEMMRSTSTNAETEEEAAATTTSRITFEDYILGYGTDVDLGCLKQLASPFPPTTSTAAASAATASTAIATTTSTAATTSTTDQNANVVPVEGGRNPQRTPPHCSSLVTIIKPEDIGWQVGEILFKVIMRYGFNVQVSIAAAADGANAELFEYQTHQWGAETTLHSMIHGEKRALWIQYTPAAATLPPVSVKIQYENQFTGKTYTYQFEHDIQPETTTTPEAAEAAEAAEEEDAIQQTIVPLILGMIQIEIFKQFREIEAARYDKDTIVREAYKTLRMLKSIEAITHTTSFPAAACQTLNLMTDTKLIIGLTTIQNQKEQKIILHARRICSAEQEIFNTGASVSRKYIESEEDYEEEAIRVINATKAAAAAAAAAANPDNQQPEENEEAYSEEMADELPSRIATVMPRYNTQDDFMDTPFPGGSYSYNRSIGSGGGSEVRALCVRIAASRNKKEDTSAEEIYRQMKSQRNSRCGGGQYGGEYDPEEYAPHYGGADDNFSSTPMNDDYTQRRMGMMRQMSSSS
jgi:hypothetical protein